MQTQFISINTNDLPETTGCKPSEINPDHDTAEYRGFYRQHEDKTYHVVIVDIQHGQPFAMTVGILCTEDRAQTWLDKALKAYDQDLPEPEDDHDKPN